MKFLKYKKYLLLFLVGFLILWYAGLTTTEFYKTDKRVEYSDMEARKIALAEGFEWSHKKDYFSTQPTKYFVRRGWIPITYKRDTVLKSKKTYYSIHN